MTPPNAPQRFPTRLLWRIYAGVMIILILAMLGFAVAQLDWGISQSDLIPIMRSM